MGKKSGSAKKTKKAKAGRTASGRFKKGHSHSGRKSGRKGHKKGHKTAHLIPNITTMASRVGKALGAGLKRPVGVALKRAKGKGEVAAAVRSVGKRLAPKKRGK